MKEQRNRSIRRLTNTVSACLVGLVLAACSNGGGNPAPGGGGGNGGNGGGGGGPGGGGGDPAALFGGVRAASDGSRGAVVANVLQPGDRYEFAPDVQEAERIAQQIWDGISARPVWMDPTQPLNTWQFYTDASFLPGPLFRWTGFNVEVGQVQFHTAGLYYSADGRGPFLAVGLQTWDYQPEFLVIESAEQFWHAITHTNGLPIVGGYRPGG